MIPTTIVGTAESFGEVTILGYAGTFRGNYISGWNIDKVKDLSGMFFSCSKLVSLPDISNWNTHNVKNMTGMFSDCSMLISLPDISKWKLNKNTEIINMFKGCQETLEIPKKFRSKEVENEE